MINTRLMAVSGAVLVLSACGQGAKIGGGKQGASEALFAASQPTKGGQDKSQKIDVSGEITVKCPEGGSATLKGFSVVLGSGGIADIGQKFNASYNQCGVKTDSGVAGLNGDLEVIQSIKVVSSVVAIEQALKGKLVWQGAIDDFLDMDIVQKVTAGALTQTTGGVAMTLKGQLTDSEGKFTFDEEVSVTAGKVTVASTSTKK